MHRRVHLLATTVGAQAVGVLRTGPSGNGLGLIPTRHPWATMNGLRMYYHDSMYLHDYVCMGGRLLVHDGLGT